MRILTVTYYYMRILSASAIHGGVVWFPIWNTHSIRPILLYRFRGDATLTMGPYRTTGMCIINYTSPEINAVVIAKALFDFS